MSGFDTFIPASDIGCFHCSASMRGEWFQGKDGDCWLHEYVQGVRPDGLPEIYTGWEFHAACPACGAWNEWTITVKDGVWVSHTHNAAGCMPPNRSEHPKS